MNTAAMGCPDVLPTLLTNGRNTRLVRVAHLGIHQEHAAVSSEPLSQSAGL